MANWILQARRADQGNKPFYYTGRAGEGWVSEDASEAWEDSEANQMRKAEHFNRYTGIHGLTFFAVAL